MILSATQVRRCVEDGSLAIDPFRAENLKEGSYTFSLDDEYFEVNCDTDQIDLRSSKLVLRSIRMSESGIELTPHSFVICQTRESISLNGPYSCFLSARGSCAQIGLNVLQSSMFVEPGTSQKLRLEVSNVGHYAVVLYPGMLVAKGIFVPMSDAREMMAFNAASSIKIVA